MPKRTIEQAQELFFPSLGEATDGVFRPKLTALERMIIGNAGGVSVAGFGAPLQSPGLSLAHLNLLTQGNETASNPAPNRTPSPEHREHLTNLYGTSPGAPGAPGTPGAAPNISRGIPAVASQIESPLEDQRDGIFGPLARNAPPRKFTGSQNLQTFLSRVR